MQSQGSSFVNLLISAGLGLFLVGGVFEGYRSFQKRYRLQACLSVGDLATLGAPGKG